jgi:hypothetical protein
MDRYIINIDSGIVDVPINFFKNMSIVKEVFILDTYFIEFNNGKLLSISKREYDKVKVDLRNLKIDYILNKKRAKN